MGMEIRVEIDEAFRTELEAVAGVDRPYSTLDAYVRDLIEADMHRRRGQAEAVLTNLRLAFATPTDRYVMVSAEDVIARGRARRGG